MPNRKCENNRVGRDYTGFPPREPSGRTRHRHPTTQKTSGTTRWCLTWVRAAGLVVALASLIACAAGLNLQIGDTVVVLGWDFWPRSWIIRYGASVHFRKPPARGVWPQDVLQIPVWWLAGGFAVPAITSQLRRRSRSAHDTTGLCRTCSYDLTGNVSGVCPESGRPVNPRKFARPPGGREGSPVPRDFKS